MEKLILLIFISICFNPAWAAEITIGQGSELILDRGGRLQSLPQLLPPGSVIEVDDSILNSASSQGRAYQQRYTNINGKTGLSSAPLIPRIKIISLPDGFPYALDDLQRHEFHMSLQSLRPATTPSAEDLERQRVANYLGISPSEVNSPDVDQDSPRVILPESTETTPMISQPEVQVIPAASEISDSTRQALYPPLCGCTDCDLMTAHKENSCNALEKASGSCIDDPSEAHDGNDWLAPANFPVHAPCEGEVVFFGNTDRFGRQLVLACEIEGRNYHFRFNHLNAVSSKLKDSRRVYKGQPIAIVGNTGTDQGYHLSHQIHEVQDPKVINDSENTFREPGLDPNVLQSIDPSYFYTKIPSSEIHSENTETKDQYLSQILSRDCPVVERRTDTNTPSQSSESTRVVQ